MSLLELDNVSKRFDGVKALDGLSFSIEEKTVTGLIGPNGAGKSTAFHVISGFLQPDGGSVYYQGHRVSPVPHKIVRSGIARSFQDLRLFSKMTVLENVLLAEQCQDSERFFRAVFATRRRSAQKNIRIAIEYLEFVGLTGKADELAENLSYGEQKLLALARLLASEAKLILLDEPVAGLHTSEIEVVLEKLKELRSVGRTILLVEHNISVIMDVSDRIIVMDQGKVVASGSPEKIQKDPLVIELYLGV